MSIGSVFSVSLASFFKAPSSAQTSGLPPAKQGAATATNAITEDPAALKARNFGQTSADSTPAFNTVFASLPGGGSDSRDLMPVTLYEASTFAAYRYHLTHPDLKLAALSWNGSSTPTGSSTPVPGTGDDSAEVLSWVQANQS